jgi:cyclase
MKRLLTICALATTVNAFAQDMSKVEIKSSEIKPGLYLLQGAGGNIVLSHGADGAFIVDDQFAPLSDKIRAEAKRLGAGDLKFVLNTHWHGDHTGGNENFGKAGAVIIAHDNVRTRMSSEQFNATMKRATPASPRAALPVVSFPESLNLHVNGTVRMIHVAHAHTDGDSLVYFQSANVLHMGDTYFNGLYPFIDIDSGGGIKGLLSALDTASKLCNGETVVVPGHGPLSTCAELASYRDMLQGFADSIGKLKAEGKSLAQAVAAKPTKAFDAKLGGKFISPEQLITAIYKSL